MAKIALFDEKIYEALPSALAFLSHMEPSPERDVSLLSALTAVSACLPGVGFERCGAVNTPHTFLCVYGDSGVGKGSLGVGPKLTALVNSAVSGQSALKKEDWQAQPANKRGLSPFYTLHQLQKCTGANLWKQLKNQRQDGTYMHLSEGSELINGLQNEMAIQPCELMNIWDQVSLTKSINTDDFVALIEHPKVAINMSVTTDMFCKFASGHLKTGLLSRFLVYKIDGSKSFVPDVLGAKEAPVMQNLDKCANIVHDVWSSLSADFYTKKVKVSNEVADSLNTICGSFAQSKQQAIGVYRPYVKRLPQSILRLAVTFSSLRQWDIDRLRDGVVKVDCTDFIDAIFEVLIKNIEQAVDTACGIELDRWGAVTAQVELDDLPEVFTTAEFSSFFENPRTSYRSLKRLQKEGFIEKISHGHYKKLQPY